MPHLAKHVLSFLRLPLAILIAWAADASAESGRYEVEINKGRLIRLSSAASTVVVADPEVADVQVLSPVLVYVSGRHVGETSILAIGGGDTVVLDGTVAVTHNLSKLKASVHEALPGAEVEFASTDNAIVLKGGVTSPYMAERIQRLASTFLRDQQSVLNFIEAKEGDQVMLKVKVAEVSRTELKRFGINLESLLTGGNFVFGLATGRDFINAGTSLLRSTNGDNSLYTGLQTGSVDINGVIDALEDDGLLTILAEPNLTTKSGVTANFLAGGEFPIPVVGEEDSVTIDYREFGVSLDFTPVVLSADKISLSVKPEVSSLSSVNAIQANGFNIPSLLTRRASTTVELGSGESFAIAGLLRRDDANDIDKVPGLGDVPVLGMLFRSTQYQQEQTELVIIVTPYIVRGVRDTELATPVDGYKPATDLERILMGRLYGEHHADALTEEQPARIPPVSEHHPRLHGPAGFILR